MMAYIQTLLIATSITLVWCQRPFFAGSRPIGYPELEKPSTTADELGNRFGEGTTQRLPLEAQGDRDLVDRLSKLPIDKQPFWYINWQALEAHRQQPQTYPIRPNPFAENPITPDNSANINSGATDLGNRSGVKEPASSTTSTTTVKVITSKAQESDKKESSTPSSKVTSKAVN